MLDEGPTSSYRATAAVAAAARYRWIWPLCLALLTGYLGQFLSVQLWFRPRAVSSIWIPGGVLLALLLLRPRRDWAALAVGTILAGTAAMMVHAGSPVVFALPGYAVTCGAVVVGAWTLVPLAPSLVSTVSGFLRYFATAVLLLPAFTGWVAAYLSDLSGMRRGVLQYWLTLWPSHAMGFLLLTPLLVTIIGDATPARRQPWPVITEAALLCVGVLTLTMGLWVAVPPAPSKLPLLLFAPVPLVLLAALRFGTLGASVGLLLVAAPAAGLNVYRGDPLGIAAGQINVHIVQLWLLATGLLVHVLAIQSSQQRLARAQLAENHRRLRTLATRLLKGQEDERTRLSRELHDGINQQIALLAIRTSALGRGRSEAIPGQLAELSASIGALADDVRRISHNLHPGMLEHVGLTVALDALVRDLSRHCDGSISFVCDRCDEQPSYELSLCLYRIAQEALGNAIRHARARAITVRLAREGGCYLLEIGDDGCGFDVARTRRAGGLGLLSIEERAGLVRGSVTLQSEIGKGTRLWVRVPAIP